MSGPPARRPIVAAIYIATLPLNTGEPPEKIATKPKPPEKNPTSKRTRRTVGPSQFCLSEGESYRLRDYHAAADTLRRAATGTRFLMP
jgi:hypothetical protein